MKQPQFEEILFSDKKLSASEKKEMHHFLRENPVSDSLYKNWSAIKLELDKAPELSPEPGFSERWQIRQQSEQRKTNQLHAFWAILISAIAAAATVYFAFGSAQGLLIFLKDFFISAANQFLEMTFFIQIVIRTAFSILQKFPLSWWTSMAMAMILLPMLWLAVFRELSTSKGVQQ